MVAELCIVPGGTLETGRWTTWTFGLINWDSSYENCVISDMCYADMGDTQLVYCNRSVHVYACFVSLKNMIHSNKIKAFSLHGKLGILS